MLIVEKAIVQDFESVSDLDALAFGPPPRPDTLRNAIDDGTCWVAREVDRIVGFALFDSTIRADRSVVNLMRQAMFRVN